MKILGIETATEVCAVALADDASILSEIMKREKHIHAEQLVPMIHQLLSSCGVELKELDGIAVSIGPGSFTGLRIGLSVAKGLTFSTNLPLVAVSTLQASAASVLQTYPTMSSIIVPVIEIQRDEFALTTFTKETLVEPYDTQRTTLVTKNSRETVSGIFREQYENYIVCGHGAEKFYSQFFGNSGSFPNITLAEKGLCSCNARSIAIAGMRQLKQNDIADIASLEPLYGKDFIAKKSTLFERITQ